MAMRVDAWTTRIKKPTYEYGRFLCGHRCLVEFLVPDCHPPPHLSSTLLVLQAQSLMKPPELYAFGSIGGTGPSEYPRQ
jgi:hypothetical protein